MKIDIKMNKKENIEQNKNGHSNWKWLLVNKPEITEAHMTLRHFFLS